MTTPRQPGDRRSALGHGAKLGRVAGVEIDAHWSVAGIIALLAALLALNVLPAWQPHRSTTSYWLVAVGTALAFLLALLAHELAHAVTARHYGMKVQRISLWMLGGLTEFDGEPPSPRADAVIAGIGPVVSLVLGGAFTGLAVLLGHGLPEAALSWLGLVNILLGVFNLLPGAPLDGGRVLRAIAWARYHDRRRATETAARAGRVLGIALVVLGFVEFFAGATTGLWLALIGWFIMTGSAGERYAAMAEQLRGLTVRDAMTSPPATAPSWWTVSDFIAYLGTAHAMTDLFVLVDVDGKPEGVLHTGALTRIAPDRRATTRLSSCRDRADTLVVAPDAPLNEVALKLQAHGGIAVVVDGGHTVATVTALAVQAAVNQATLGVALPRREDSTQGGGAGPIPPAR